MTLDAERAYVDARATLLQAADSSDPVTRAHAMEALARTLGEQAGNVFVEGLDDENPLVRFSAAMAIGDVAYAPAEEKLLDMAQQAEPDRRVLTAIVYALHKLGNDRFATQLGRLLFDEAKEVRANAAMAMGKMGEPSAIEPLRKLLRDEQDIAVQMEVVEAMAALGDEASKHLLEAYTKTQFVDDRLRAIQALARVQSDRAPLVFADLAEPDQVPPVRVAATGALAQVQVQRVPDELYDYCVRAARGPRTMLEKGFARSDDVTEMSVLRLQRLAARSLGRMDRPAAVDVLRPLLEASDGSVRVAAAMSILRLLRDRVAPEARSTVAESAGSGTRPRLHTAGGRD
jgi:HEAT repeat protein